MGERLTPNPAEIAYHFSRFDPIEPEIIAQKPLILYRQKAETSNLLGCGLVLVIGAVIVTGGLIVYASQPDPLKPGEVRIERNDEQDFKPLIEEKSEPWIDFKGSRNDLGEWIDKNIFGENKSPYDQNYFGR